MSDSRYTVVVEKITQNNEQAFEELFSIFYHRLLRFAISFTKSRELADEVVLDVFMNLWNRRDKLGSVSNLETYLFISVRNSALNCIKKEKKLNFDLLEEFHINLAKDDYTSESAIISTEEIRAINRAIDKLPPKCKIIFKLLHEEEMGKKEIAKILDISVKTIDNQIAIAIKKIADVLNLDLSEAKRLPRLLSFILTF